MQKEHFSDSINPILGNLVLVNRNDNRDNPFLEANLYISDDVSKKVRDDRKKLKKRYINEIRSREEVDFAYIPWNVPARILYKDKDSAKLKSFFLSDQ